MINLKDYRERELPLFIIANVLIFLIVHHFIRIDANDLMESIKVLPEVFISVIFFAVAYGFILIIECLFTSAFKNELVYLFGLFSLPGCTIFSDIKDKNKDKRFSYQKLAEKYSSIYDNLPAENKAKKGYENEQWYSIYSKHHNVQMILISERDSLLCRDVYIATLAMIGMYIVAVATSRLVTLNLIYFVFLILIAIITNFGARCKAERFAYNVIAYDIDKSLKESKS